MDYQALSKNGIPRQEHSVWIPFVFKIATAILVCELSMYVYFFAYLYKYNNGLQILTQEKKKLRNKTNAQTLIGQFVLFVSFFAYVVFLSLAFSSGETGIAADTKDLGVIVKSLHFGLFSLIHCLLIPEMRENFKKYLPKELKFFKIS